MIRRPPRSTLTDTLLSLHDALPIVLSPLIAQRLVRPTLKPATALTARELEVLGLVAEGLSNQRIGERLFLSQATVKSHLVHVFGKLGVDSRTSAIAAARAAALLR